MVSRCEFVCSFSEAYKKEEGKGGSTTTQACPSRDYMLLDSRPPFLSWVPFLLLVARVGAISTINCCFLFGLESRQAEEGEAHQQLLLHTSTHTNQSSWHVPVLVAHGGGTLER